MTHTQIRLPLSALFLAVATLAGCGGDSDSPPGAAKTAQTITFSPTAAITVGGGTGTLAATSTSGLAVAFSSTTTSICTVSGTTLTPVAAGTCHIEASQAGDATYEAATVVGQDITVNPAVLSTTLVSFEESPAPALAGFGGAEDSTVVVDPEDSGNHVVKVVKSATAEVWAGTTASICPNQAIVTLPISDSNHTMTARVWSPDAGIPVNLKVEDASDPSHSVETLANVTTASGWQTLTFDFANQRPGTAALNVAYNFNKASIFFNFGTDGATVGSAKTYYFDDLKFIGSNFSVACPSVTPTLVFSNGYTSTNTTAQGGAWGYFSGNFTSYAHTYTGGDFADATPAVAADLTSFYISVTTSAPTTAGYIGMYVTYASGGLTLSGQTNLLIELGIDANHFQQASNKDITVTIEGLGQGCNPKVNRTVTPTTDQKINYTLPLNTFTTISESCGGAYTTAAQVLALPVNAVNSQLDFPNANTTVVNGGAYGTGIARGKTSFQ